MVYNSFILTLLDVSSKLVVYLHYNNGYNIGCKAISRQLKSQSVQSIFPARLPHGNGMLQKEKDRQKWFFEILLELRYRISVKL